MKYIALTFDDGREDNYTIAFPILKKYGLTGTIFITTGYIDGTWKKEASWKSAGEPLSIEQLKIMRDYGIELGLHGDKHMTEIDDFKISLNKMQSYDLCDNIPIGYSIPNSNVSKEILMQFRKQLLGKDIAYIRSGRRCNISKLSIKLLFGAYTFLKSQSAYNYFNLNNLAGNDVGDIRSIVIRYNDSPEMILKFIKKVPDESKCVFMLHSILPSESLLYGTDPWNWSNTAFDELCAGLASQTEVKVKTLREMEKVK